MHRLHPGPTASDMLQYVPNPPRVSCSGLTPLLGKSDQDSLPLPPHYALTMPYGITTLATLYMPGSWEPPKKYWMNDWYFNFLFLCLFPLLNYKYLELPCLIYTYMHYSMHIVVSQKMLNLKVFIGILLIVTTNTMKYYNFSHLFLVTFYWDKLHMTKWKKPIWKGYILYGSNYTTFWKSQNYRDSGRTGDCQGLEGRGRWISRARRILREV